ncbi:hypothetical protein BTN50_1425 [Candidatus Enterovibrio altilux]|uniref:Uncharacterized protein n=1 Tax=Candidatus Enterovibrio altilux TaxID=1927128 RepID=A0A291BA89_9GAMM|nr:hypothetical protein BTN50_1425 [Candidatus Enterovibrio luxaltus]
MHIKSIYLDIQYLITVILVLVCFHSYADISELAIDWHLVNHAL